MGLDRIPDDKEIEEKMADFYNKILPKKEPHEIAVEEFRTPDFTPPGQKLTELPCSLIY
jgi:hypothetical protein